MLFHRFALPPPLRPDQAEALLQATGQFIDTTCRLYDDQALLLDIASQFCGTEWATTQRELLKEAMEVNVQVIGSMLLELQRFPGLVMVRDDASMLSGKLHNIGLCDETGRYMIEVIGEDAGPAVIQLNQGRQLSLAYGVQPAELTGFYL